MSLSQRITYYIAYFLMRLSPRIYFLLRARKYHYDSKEARKYYFLSSKEKMKNTIFSPNKSVYFLEKMKVQLCGTPDEIFKQICEDRDLDEFDDMEYEDSEFKLIFPLENDEY